MLDEASLERDVDVRLRGDRGSGLRRNLSECRYPEVASLNTYVLHRQRKESKEERF